MSKEIIELNEDISGFPLYSEDLAPVPPSKRTWTMWSLAALWVGMAVCIPTYMLASSIILNGISWLGALVIIGLANLIITVPMVLSGHAGVKYGIPFPVLGRSSFGFRGIHIPAIIRGLIAAVWFGIQTWIGGISIYSIWCVTTGQEITMALDAGKFIGFFIFWGMNVYFIIKGTESIKKLEMLAAPILVLMGIGLIIWGTTNVGGFGKVLKQSAQLKNPSAYIETTPELRLVLNLIKDADGNLKSDHFQFTTFNEDGTEFISDRMPITTESIDLNRFEDLDTEGIASGSTPLELQVSAGKGDAMITSSQFVVEPFQEGDKGFMGNVWPYLIMLTAMVGFWATMSISIADITRYSRTQAEQVKGQFIGLPGTMMLYSFVGIFVTCAALVMFDDVLVRGDAPWDPAALLAKLDGVAIVIVSQIFLLIATLSTNIAANVIAPANAFSNAFPKKLNFTGGRLVTTVLGIIICPWWIINHIIPFLLFVSSLLGPVVAILICDYFIIRKTKLDLAGLYRTDGEYAFGGSGYNRAAIISFIVGAFFAGIGNFVEPLRFLYDLSWFTGFIISFVLYYLLTKKAGSR